MEQQAEAITTQEGAVNVQSTLKMIVTDMAKDKLQVFLGDDRHLAKYGVRISVQPGGCSGASYGMAFDEKAGEGEVELVANGVKLWVDPTHLPLLNGLTIDFVDELMGGGFKIHNPNAAHSCACGKSFSA